MGELTFGTAFSNPNQFNSLGAAFRKLVPEEEPKPDRLMEYWREALALFKSQTCVLVFYDTWNYLDFRLRIILEKRAYKMGCIIIEKSEFFKFMEEHKKNINVSISIFPRHDKATDKEYLEAVFG